MKATIKQNIKLPSGRRIATVPYYSYFKMTLGAVDSFPDAKPGQFVMLRGDWGIDTQEDTNAVRLRTDPLLRRPFSIYRVNQQENEIQIVYRVMGKGTKRISELSENQEVDIIGPLGIPFERPEGKRKVILAAGSIGVPPLIALAEQMEEKPLLIFGGKTENDVIFLKDDLEQLGLRTIYVAEKKERTEGKTLCIEGTVISVLSNHVGKGDLVYACGPNRMLAEIARMSAKIGFEAYVSFEERMACGIGVCLGCAVRHTDGRYVHVCKDGPVFNVTDIDWDST
jgi:dihydroorotate dehydrogenase electron transfer subunit